MCGIVGIFGVWDQHNTYKTLEYLLKIDSIRGEDSTGVCSVFVNNEIQVVKELGHAYDFLNYSSFYEETSFNKHTRKPAKLLLGHNRSTTVGATSIENAHPFTYGDITCVHNGTIYNHNNLTDTRFKVDSEAITYSLHINGIHKTWKDIQGAAALAWWDASNNSINLIRNKERPLHFLLNKTNDRLVFASEKWMLDAVRIKNFFSDWAETIFIPNPHYLHSFTLANNKIITKEEKIEGQKEYVPNLYSGYNFSVISYFKNDKNKKKSNIVNKTIRCKTCNEPFESDDDKVSINASVHICDECAELLDLLSINQKTLDEWNDIL